MKKKKKQKIWYHIKCKNFTSKFQFKQKYLVSFSIIKIFRYTIQNSNTICQTLLSLCPAPTCRHNAPTALLIELSVRKYLHGTIAIQWGCARGSGPSTGPYLRPLQHTPRAPLCPKTPSFCVAERNYNMLGALYVTDFLMRCASYERFYLI